MMAGNGGNKHISSYKHLTPFFQETTDISCLVCIEYYTTVKKDSPYGRRPVTVCTFCSAERAVSSIQI